MMRQRRNIRNARLAAARRKAQNKQLLVDGTIVTGVMIVTMIGIFIVLGALQAGGT
jgi:septum formation inhibitor MinC